MSAEDVSRDRRRAELGAFLRTRRARLRPADVGLPQRRRRHVPGLRREEVAQLAEVGVSWYALLEQGRIARVGEAPFRRVLEALGLNASETRHALALARDAEPRAPSDARTDAFYAYVRERTGEIAFATDDASTVVAWNPDADALFDFASRPPERRMLLAMMVRDARTRAVFGAWDETLGRMIRVVRRSSVDRPTAALDELVRELRAESPEFDAAWRRHDVEGATTHVCPIALGPGRVVPMQFLAFTPVDHRALTLVTLRPAASAPRGEALPAAV